MGISTFTSKEFVFFCRISGWLAMPFSEPQNNHLENPLTWLPLARDSGNPLTRPQFCEVAWEMGAEFCWTVDARNMKQPFLSETTPSPPKFNVNVACGALAPMEKRSPKPQHHFWEHARIMHAETLRFGGAGVQHSVCVAGSVSTEFRVCPPARDFISRSFAWWLSGLCSATRSTFDG